MNSPQGKSILALVRGGDYAHPGEEDAIALAAEKLNRSCVDRLLDVGCGRGGTADWFYSHGWGNVVAVDIDGDSIEYARTKYPGIEFLQFDVMALHDLNRGTFDLAYLFNSFYAFPDQRVALKAIRSICRTGAQLLIFDYTKPMGMELPEYLGSEIGRPIVIGEIDDWLAESRWRLTSVDDWSAKYVAAYGDLLRRFERNRAAIVASAGNDWYQYVAAWYASLRKALEQGALGGAVLTAVAQA